MRTALRASVWLLVVFWLGALMFFPVVASVAFKVLPSAHEAGLVVRGCLLVLHTEGLIAGAALLLLLLISARRQVFVRPVIGPVLCTAAMLLLTAFSQYRVMPRMERDRLAAGGDIDQVPAGDVHRTEFNRLHVASERLEEGVLAAGVLMVVLLARPQYLRIEVPDQ